LNSSNVGNALDFLNAWVFIIFDISIDARVGYGPGTSGNTIFPNYFQIDYLKIWQQKTSCDTVESFCASAFNHSTYTYAVKKSISIGGSGCTTSTINTSDNVSLWATDYILIDQGTVINPNGSGSYSADITLCPN
jgi:hypothetical protein